jgi:hypothetical protein
MSKLTEKRTKPELQLQPSQMPSPRMETQKPQSQKRLWLLTGVLVLALIVIGVAASQASKSSQSTKTTPQAMQLLVDQPQATHDMDHTLTVDPDQPTHDMDHTLTVDPAQPTHDMDHTLTVGP